MASGPSSDLFDMPAPLAVEHLGKRVSGIPAGQTRVLYLKRQLDGAPPLPLVRLLACAQREAAAGTLEARLVVDAFGVLVAEGLFEGEALEAMASAAVELCEHGVLNLVQVRRDEEENERVLEPPKGSLAAEGETLGRRKALARTATGDLLDRILRDTHPDVIRNALLNPRMSEELTVRLASRRPTTSAILDVIARSRFRVSTAVRRALVRNPYCDPQLACQLVASLTRVELLDVAHDETLADEVREAARLLIEVKPPRHFRDTR